MCELIEHQNFWCCYKKVATNLSGENKNLVVHLINRRSSHHTLHKNWSFLSRISSVNVISSSHLLNKSLMENFIFVQYRNAFTSIFVGVFFYLSSFSFMNTDKTIQRAARKEKGTFYIPLIHFHQLTTIQNSICNFAYEITHSYL